MRLLRLLLHTKPPANILHSGLGVGSLLCVRNLTSSVPASQVPPIPRGHVRWFGIVFHHPHRPWLDKIRLGNSNVENESGLDGFDDDIQPHRRRVICLTGEFLALEFLDFPIIVTYFRCARFPRSGTLIASTYGVRATKSCIVWSSVQVLHICSVFYELSIMFTDMETSAWTHEVALQQSKGFLLLIVSPQRALPIRSNWLNSGGAPSAS